MVMIPGILLPINGIGESPSKRHRWFPALLVAGLVPLFIGCGGGGGGSTPVTPPVTVVAPQITGQPGSVTVNQGSPASFTVAASGSAPLAYQWFKGAAALAGASGATCSIPAAQATDAGSYTVTVANSAGTATSAAAVLVVNPPVQAEVAPQITGQPGNVTVAQGSPASFTVTATGTAPLTYQWFKGGTAVTGATAATYGIAAAQASDAGSYTVTVGNAAGTATSAAAALVVTPEANAPVITAFSSAPATIGLGAGSILTWDVTGANTLSINNGVGPLSVAKGSVNVSPLQSTTFTLTAANSSSTVIATATVVVDATPFAIASFAAGGTILPWGGSTTLSWAIKGLPVTLTLDGVPATGSSLQVFPLRRQSYTLAGANAGGTDSRTLSVGAQGLDLVAGNGAGTGYQDGVGASAAFCYVYSLASDRNGYVYAADYGNSNIRRIAPDGTVTTLAGVLGKQGYANGDAASAQFNWPLGIAVDGQGNLYLADYNNQTIRRISASGQVTTLAGSAGLIGSADGNGSAAKFNYPNGVAVDGNGNVFVADRYNYTIRKIDAAGNVSTLAGSPGLIGLVDGLGAAARFRGPRSLTTDASGNLYLADGNAIRKITPAGAVTTLAGSAAAGSSDGIGAAATFYSPTGLVIDGAGSLYVCDRANHTIRKVTSAGVVTTLAGSAGQMGSQDGTGAGARFSRPAGITLLPSGSLVVSDEMNALVRTLTPAGVVATWAGTPPAYGSIDGAGSVARFHSPVGLAIDQAGNTYVADYENHTIRKVTPSGAVTTLAGSAGNPGTADGSGSGARFNHPNGVAVDPGGNVFVADYGNHTIRRVTPAGAVSTIAGTPGVAGSLNGPAAAAGFYYPCAVAVGASGAVYVADTSNCTLRVIRDGNVTTLAGWVEYHGSQDGSIWSAQFNNPTGIAVDSAENVYVADSSNNVIRKVDQAHSTVTTLAGSPTAFGWDDGKGASARFNYPYTLACGPNGDLFVADGNSGTIRKISPAGDVTTVAGTPGHSQWQPGPLPGTLGNVLGVAVTAAGDLMVSNTNAIVQVTAPGAPGAPVIAVQPLGFNATAGTTVTLSVVPSGYAPFTYQWSRNGAAITGATGATYTPPALTAADDGTSFVVVVSNASGSVTSNPALIGILAATAPVVMMQPAGQSLAAGETTTFTVVATSMTPMTYQWSKNGTVIAGANGPAYSIPAASASDNQASYRVAITNSVGTTTSSPAVLTVLGGTSTLTQAILQAKSTLSLLVNTRGSLGTSFFPAQASTLQSDLAGANVSFAYTGRNLKWLRDVLNQLLASGGTSLTGSFDTGTYAWGSSFSGEEVYPFALTRSGDTFSYTINGGSDGSWAGTVQGLATWPDGLIRTLSLVNASFPGDMRFVPYGGSEWGGRYVPIYKDVLNATVTTSPVQGGGADQSVAGTIQRIPSGASSSALDITLTSATWTEYATGMPAGQSHVWLPRQVALSMTTGTYTFTGSVDCSGYQNNPTAATAVSNGPGWGWPALNAAGATFTSVHAVGAASDGQGSSTAVDLTIAVGNYPTLILNQPLSPSNAPVGAITAACSLQTPNQPLMSITVTSANQGMFQIPATLVFTYGSTVISGTGTYYTPVAGQASGVSFFADLKDQAGTDIVLQVDLKNVLTGTVSYGGSTIGTISDVGFGPRVLFVDGTFQTLW